MESNLNEVYSKLDQESKSIIDMYITARQFKNAILINEMISLPDTINGEVLKCFGKNIGYDIFTIKGDRIQNKIFPFLVNKAFACEVYLKLIIKSEHTDLEELVKKKIIKKNDKHNLLSLLNLIRYDLKGLIVNSINKNSNIEITPKEIEEHVKNISNIFVDWRYIYEKANNQDNIANYGFLNSFCEILDIYTKLIIKNKFNYDVDKDTR